MKFSGGLTHASSRQSTPAKALHEYGRLVRTIYICRYIADEELRRRIRRQLNKGESLHVLRRELFFAHQGHVRRRHLDDQIDQALCLTLATNACVLWTTIYLGDALDSLRGEGVEVTDEAAAHLTSAQHDHINLVGNYNFLLPGLGRKAASASCATPTPPTTSCLAELRPARAGDFPGSGGGRDVRSQFGCGLRSTVDL